MSDTKAKMYQIQFRLELCPRPHWGAYSAPPDPLAGFRGLLLKEGEESEVGRVGDTREEDRRVGRDRQGTPRVGTSHSMFEILKNTLPETHPLWGPISLVGLGPQARQDGCGFTPPALY